MTTHAVGNRIRFPELAPTAFEHPMDSTALEALRRTPGLDKLLQRLSGAYIEKAVRLAYTIDSLKLSPLQLPEIYALLTEAAAILDVAPPDLYLLQMPFPNAFAIGMERHTIVLTSGLVELLEPEELLGVIGHELGHIKSGHMLYRTMAIFLATLGVVALRNMPFVDLVTSALRYALLDWSRKSELTADRAGLLVTQDAAVAVRIMLKLAGGTRSSAGGLNVQEFLNQALEYEDSKERLVESLFAAQLNSMQTHPFPALRAREIDVWSRSKGYRNILAGEYPTTVQHPSRRCKQCAAQVNNPLFTFCAECGSAL